MTGDRYGSTRFSDKLIYCDIPSCVNRASEMFDEDVDEFYVYPVCLCKKCKEEW
jgi:hypothetical protein